VKFELKAGLPLPQQTGPAANQGQTRKRDLMQLPIFKKAAEVLGAQIYGADDEFNPVAPLPSKTTAPADDEDDSPAPVPDPEEP
jgi:hypothetical protein